MKIAHISDLHLDKTYKKANLKNTLKLLEYISDNNFDHVIITGDITENAEASAFELARNIFKKHKLLDPEKLTITIGNHDIYGGVHLAEDILNYPGKCKNIVYEHKITEFEYYFREAFAKERIIKPFPGRLFPFIKEFDDFILAGLNSIDTYSVLKNPFASNGRIRKHQLDEIQIAIDKNGLSNKKIIVLAHHHFCRDNIEDLYDNSAIWRRVERQTMKLRNKKRIMKHLRNMGVRTVLHGHLHESAEYERKGIKFLNSGGSILSENSHEMKLNKMEINSSTLANEFLSIPKAACPELKELRPRPYLNYLTSAAQNVNEINMN